MRLAIAVIPKFAAGHLARLHPYVIVKPPRATSAARRGEGESDQSPLLDLLDGDRLFALHVDDAVLLTVGGVE